MPQEKWTQGPWQWSSAFTTQDDRPTWSLIGSDGYGILSCDGIGNAPQGLGDKVNASLIAAAPDLYEALADVVAAMRKYEMDVDADAPAAHREMMRRAYAALAKARGETTHP